MRSGLVSCQRFLKGFDYFIAIFSYFHVNEVDDNDPAYVPQTQLFGDFLSCFQIVSKNTMSPNNYEKLSTKKYGCLREDH